METYRRESQLYRVLMHPVRLAILDLLREGEHCVCSLAGALGYRQAYVSQHLMVLRRFGLVDTRRDGVMVYYRVVRPEIYKVIDAMHQIMGDPSGYLKKGQLCQC